MKKYVSIIAVALLVVIMCAPATGLAADEAGIEAGDRVIVHDGDVVALGDGVVVEVEMESYPTPTSGVTTRASKTRSITHVGSFFYKIAGSDIKIAEIKQTVSATYDGSKVRINSQSKSCTVYDGYGCRLFRSEYSSAYVPRALGTVCYDVYKGARGKMCSNYIEVGPNGSSIMSVKGTDY
ncbi:MAG TPA: hypothetical protein DEB31_08490 [Clostridiales bacterium]|nr:hypothetical protein [Clostridiales bacterium]